MKKSKYIKSYGKKKALFINLSKQLLKNEIIKTTIKKAKILKMFVEPLINLSKTVSLNNKRKFLKKINDKYLLNKVFTILKKRYQNRQGGYTRIIKYGYRKGDGSLIVFIELVNRQM